MPEPVLYKYTPGQAPPELLEAAHVPRGGIMERIETRAAQWCAGAGHEHTLILGPRGTGKTHLLHVLAHRLTRQQHAAPLRIAVFPEESYTVGSADELILQVWNRLGHDPISAGSRATAAAQALDSLREEHTRSGARFLVLLDGLDLVLDQLREADEAQLHPLLTTHDHICVVATAAHPPLGVTDADRPLYGAFRLERLRPLQPDEAENLLRKRADQATETDLLDRWAEVAPRVQTINELAGGNPRLLLMLYQSLQMAELPSVLQAFRALLDELTPFFKHVVESRAPQQRKLLQLAALHDRGASPLELARESGLPERQVSALLGPLVKDGLLQRVRKPGSRASAYPFNEPLLRMWLQMRSSPEEERRVRCVVEFFRLWYESAESEYDSVFHALSAFVADVGVPRRGLAAYDQLLTRFADTPEATIATGRSKGSGESFAGALRRVLADPNLSEDDLPLVAFSAAVMLTDSLKQGNRQNTLDGLAILCEGLERVSRGIRDTAAVQALRRIFSSGDLELCQEAIGSLKGLVEDSEMLLPFQGAIDYIRGGRDPYHLAALSPEMRRAVELVATTYEQT